MGLVNLKYIEKILLQRRVLSEYYDEKLALLNVKKPVLPSQLSYNYSYYPIIFKTEAQLLTAIKNLRSISVNPRRYFYPSLNRLPFLKDARTMEVSESISRRVLSLPGIYDLSKKDMDRICIELVNKNEVDQ